MSITQRSRPRPRSKKIQGQGTDFLRTEPLEVKAKDQGHNFLKLWSANFLVFFSTKGIIAFRKVFDHNSKVVVSKNNKYYFEVLRVSSNFDYVP